MDPLIVMHMSVDVTCGIILILLLFCHIEAARPTNKASKLFSVLLALNIALLFCSVVSWGIDMAVLPTNPVAARIAGYGIYIFTYAWSITLSHYLCAYIEPQASSARRLLLVTYSLYFVNILLLVMTPFTGALFSFNAENRFEIGPMSWLIYLLGFLGAVVQAAFIIKHYKSLGRNDTISLMSYMLLFLSVIAVQVLSDNTIFLINAAMSICMLVIFTRIQLAQGKRLKERELELQEARTNIMLSQIQPHFLYNALVAIRDLCYTDAEQAAEAVGEFSSYLRSNLDSLYIKTLIPFEKELQHVNHYLFLEQKRFEDTFTVEFDLQVTDFLLPALTLQPMVENAIRHGITKRPAGGIVTISTAETPESFIITVQDNGVGFDPTKSNLDDRHHIGIENVDMRLAAMCTGTLTVTGKPGVGTTVVITIPRRDGQ